MIFEKENNSKSQKQNRVVLYIHLAVEPFFKLNTTQNLQPENKIDSYSSSIITIKI